MASVRANITPSVLEWARKRARRAPEEVARRLDVSPGRYTEWESGEAKPTLVQLREMARFLGRPMAAFYADVPPEDPDTLTQLRRFPGRAVHEETPELAREVLTALDRRELALALYSDLGETPPVVGLQLAVGQDAEEAGKWIRKRLGVTTDKQARWPNPSRALHDWRRGIEEAGVLVFHMPGIQMREMRGLAVVKDPLPIIGLNSKDALNGRIFTLIHEYAHILLGDSVVHAFRRPLYRINPSYTREDFCNSVAAATLVPRDDLAQQARRIGKGPHSEWFDQEIASIANRYRVSKAVIVRRLGKARLIEGQCFDALREQYDNIQSHLSAGARGPDPYRNKLMRLGSLLPRLAFRAYYSERITMSELAGIMGTKVANLDRFESLVTGFAYAFGA